MNVIKETINFIKNPENLSWVFLLLPLLVFYLVNKKIVFVSYLIIFFILLAYKYDLTKKNLERMRGRISQKKKKKPLLRHFRDLWKDADEEFRGYLFAWPFFGILFLSFIGLYIYSATLSFNLSSSLFALHIGLGIFWIFFALMDNKNLDKLSKMKNEKN